MTQESVACIYYLQTPERREVRNGCDGVAREVEMLQLVAVRDALHALGGGLGWVTLHYIVGRDMRK